MSVAETQGQGSCARQRAHEMLRMIVALSLAPVADNNQVSISPQNVDVMANLQNFVQEFQPIPLKLRQSEPVIFLVAQRGNIFTIVCQLGEARYCLCVN